MLMNFESALQGLRFGHKLRRGNWPEGNYLFLKDGRFLEGHVSGHGDVPCTSISDVDILADDWEIM